MFIQNILDFLIVAFSIFLCVKLLNKGKEIATKKEREAAEAKAKAEAEAKANEPVPPTTEDFSLRSATFSRKRNNRRRELSEKDIPMFYKREDRFLIFTFVLFINT